MNEPSLKGAGQPPDWKSDLWGMLRSKASLLTLAALALVVGARLGLNWWSEHGLVAPPLSVRVVHPARRPMERDISLPADVEGIEEARLFAHVSGYLKQLYHDEGDRVAQGALLATIDAPDVVQEYNRAKADAELQEVTRKRYEELLKGQVVSQQEYDTLKAQADEAQARLRNAEANMEYTRITAPFSGSIARRYVYPGDLVSAQSAGGREQPLFLLVNESVLRVALSVPQRDVANIVVGHPAEIRVDSYPGRVFPAVVSRIDEQLDVETKTQRVLVDIKNTDGKLHAGMYASASLRLQSDSDALTVPIEAVQGPAEDPYVAVVSGGILHHVPVKTGMTNAESAEIVSGLDDSAEVALPGGQPIADGAHVSAQEQAPAAQEK